MKEIERKWLVPVLPNLGSQRPIYYKRFFLFNRNGIEIRIQQKGDKFEFERKIKVDEITRKVCKFEITKDEFVLLQKISIGEIIRESYQLDDLSIKVYKGKYEGLIRAEVEFESAEKAMKYEALPWFGVEITNSKLGQDKALIALNKAQFDDELKSLIELMV